MNEHKYVTCACTKQTSVVTDSSISIEHIEIKKTSGEIESKNKSSEEQMNIIKVDISKKIEQLKTLISTINERVRILEKNIALKEIAGKLNKHYEQNRCHK